MTAESIGGKYKSIIPERGGSTSEIPDDVPAPRISISQIEIALSVIENDTTLKEAETKEYPFDSLEVVIASMRGTSLHVLSTLASVIAREEQRGASEEIDPRVLQEYFPTFPARGLRIIARLIDDSRNLTPRKLEKYFGEEYGADKELLCEALRNGVSNWEESLLGKQIYMAWQTYRYMQLRHFCDWDKNSPGYSANDLKNAWLDEGIEERGIKLIEWWLSEENCNLLEQLTDPNTKVHFEVTTINNISLLGARAQVPVRNDVIIRPGDDQLVIVDFKFGNEEFGYNSAGEMETLMMCMCGEVLRKYLRGRSYGVYHGEPIIMKRRKEIVIPFSGTFFYYLIGESDGRIREVELTPDEEMQRKGADNLRGLIMEVHRRKPVFRKVVNRHKNTRGWKSPKVEWEMKEGTVHL